MTRVVLRLALLTLLFTPRAATAQDPRQNAPGQFDFYVLSLSWSPSFCAGAAERGADAVARNVQCGPRPYSSSCMAVAAIRQRLSRILPNSCAAA